mmetsp:Transcript_30043/g.75616  ORF Transcript_30043/g.75616 Transcript_30043/m.75616 type:complete len:265 (+) Transcript_30043:1215-2009(+)
MSETKPFATSQNHTFIRLCKYLTLPEMKTSIGIRRCIMLRWMQPSRRSSKQRSSPRNRCGKVFYSIWDPSRRIHQTQALSVTHSRICGMHTDVCWMTFTAALTVSRQHRHFASSTTLRASRLPCKCLMQPVHTRTPSVRQLPTWTPPSSATSSLCESAKPICVITPTWMLLSIGVLRNATCWHERWQVISLTSWTMPLDEWPRRCAIWWMPPRAVTLTRFSKLRVCASTLSKHRLPKPNRWLARWRIRVTRLSWRMLSVAVVIC